jgi:hypothetical protein
MLPRSPSVFYNFDLNCRLITSLTLFDRSIACRNSHSRNFYSMLEILSTTTVRSCLLAGWQSPSTKSHFRVCFLGYDLGPITFSLETDTKPENYVMFIGKCSLENICRKVRKVTLDMEKRWSTMHLLLKPQPILKNLAVMGFRCKHTRQGQCQRLTNSAGKDTITHFFI